MNSAEIKERERQTWLSVTEGWRRQDATLRKGAEPVTERMLALAEIESGHWVLDIASGTGEPAIPAAHRVGDQGRVIGTDLVEEMLAIAREKAAAAGLNNIEFHCVDGEALEFSAESFDTVTIRWGLMFMPEPETCLRQVHQLLKPGGRVVAACWAGPEHNPCFSLAINTLREYMEVPVPPAGAPGIFAFADPDRLRRTMQSAGFRDVTIESVELTVIETENGAAYWDVLRDLAGPIAALVNRLDAQTREAFARDLAHRADRLCTGDTLPMRGMTWVASAVK